MRTVVLVKSKDYADYLVFEFDTIRYDPELYYFEWNKRMNLEGYERLSKKHKFTWQPSGSQFTIIEDIPEKRLHISISVFLQSCPCQKQPSTYTAIFLSRNTKSGCPFTG